MKRQNGRVWALSAVIALFLSAAAPPDVDWGIDILTTPALAAGNGNGAESGNNGNAGNANGADNGNGGIGNGAGNGAGNGGGAGVGNSGNAEGIASGNSSGAGGQGNGNSGSQGNGFGLANGNGAAGANSNGRGRAAILGEEPAAKSAPGQAKGPQTNTAGEGADGATSARGIITIGLSEVDLEKLQAMGFAVERLGGRALGLSVVNVVPPSGMSLAGSRTAVTAVNRNATNDFNSYYYLEGRPCLGDSCDPISMIGWHIPAGSPCGDVAIGLVDTGIDLAEQAINGQHVERIFGGAKALTPASASHGTAIAALLVGRADGPVPGLLPDAHLLVAEAFYRDDAGVEKTDVATLVQAIDALARKRVLTINLSLSGPPNDVLRRVIEAALARNIVIVAAVGNRGPGAPPAYPAAYPGVIGVTAVDRSYKIYPRAAQGDFVDFAAPGVGLRLPGYGDGRPVNGTSFAVPFVAAAAAAVRAMNPKMNPEEVETELARTARDLGRPGKDPVFGWGLVQTVDICMPLTVSVGAAVPQPR